MIIGFKTWLKEAEITENNALTPLGEKLQLLGSDSPITWGVIYTNLCYESPIINWYAKKLKWEGRILQMISPSCLVKNTRQL